MTLTRETLEVLQGGTKGPFFVHDFRGASDEPSLRDITVSCDHPATITVCSMDNALTRTEAEALGNARKIALVNQMADVCVKAAEFKAAKEHYENVATVDDEQFDMEEARSASDRYDVALSAFSSALSSLESARASQSEQGGGG